MSKRFIPLLAALLLALTACQATPDSPDEPTTTTTETTTTTTVTTTIPSQVVGDMTIVGDPNMGQVAEDFELPLKGATGFASVDTATYTDAALTVDSVTLQPGDAFTVLEAVGDTVWYVQTEDSKKVYVKNTYCYLNIADVIPSVVLDNTNSYSSVFLSSGKEIPSITGEQLYNAKTYNPRLEREEFLVACNWQMVQRIYHAQQKALEEGYTLVINEAFRPIDVQHAVAGALKKLYDTDDTVRRGIDTAPWNISWFIASRPSTHQMGCAIDTSLAKVNRMEYRLCGEYRYGVVTDYTLCEMPTPIHELSARSVSLAKPVNSYSPTAWKGIKPADAMTKDALRLQKYCTAVGLSPLASEWWHFNDLSTKGVIGDNFSTDPFYLDTCVSKKP